MAEIRIQGHIVEIDIAEELSEYEFGNTPSWGADKLIASSPFRTDNAPSFFVNLTGEYAGTFGDSGAIDDEYARGGFVKLTSLLRNISYEEACEYLIGKYGVLHEIRPDEPIRLRHPKLISNPSSISYIETNPIVEATSPYLLKRGITAETQEIFGVGYGRNVKGYTAIPWHSPEGRLANVKYRSTKGKKFFYEDGSTPINKLVYAVDLAEEDAVLVEGEIDAMSWREAGVTSIAIAGSHLSDEQVEIIKRSRIKRMYLGGDNDVQGRKLNAQAVRELRGFVELRNVDYGKEKDANDVLLRHGALTLINIKENSEYVSNITLPG